MSEGHQKTCRKAHLSSVDDLLAWSHGGIVAQKTLDISRDDLSPNAFSVLKPVLHD